MQRKLTPSEIIFATNFYISDKEVHEKYISYVKKRFSKFYKFNNNDVEKLIEFERLKINIRGNNIDHYLFSQNLSLDDKLTIIEDFYRNDAFWLFTTSEIFIAFNIGWKLLSKLKSYEKRIKTIITLNKIKEKTDLLENIIKESFLQTYYICLYDDNLRFMYGDAYMPTEEEEKEINNYVKKLSKN